MSSRGCPYNCTYCFNHAYYQIYHRERRGYQRTVDDVIAEVNAVRARWPLEQVVFVDDLFILRNDWLEELAEKWPRAGGPALLLQRARQHAGQGPAQGRAAQAGRLPHGQHGHRDRQRPHPRRPAQAAHEPTRTSSQAGRMVRDAGMHITATNILGLPTSTLEDDSGHDAAQRRRRGSATPTPSCSSRTRAPSWASSRRSRG